MPLGKASIKRATGAIEKQGAKKEKAAFSADCVLTEVALEELRIPAGKACAASDALVKSVKKYGVIKPVFAVRKGEEITLSAGFARVAAAKEAGLAKVPAVVCELAGTGAAAALKDLQTTKAAPAAQPAPAAASAVQEEIAAADASDSIHEEKFKAVKAFQVGHSLPDYLL